MLLSVHRRAEWNEYEVCCVVAQIADMHHQKLSFSGLAKQLEISLAATNKWRVAMAAGEVPRISARTLRDMVSIYADVLDCDALCAELGYKSADILNKTLVSYLDAKKRELVDTSSMDTITVHIELPADISEFEKLIRIATAQDAKPTSTTALARVLGVSIPAAKSWRAQLQARQADPTSEINILPSNLQFMLAIYGPHGSGQIDGKKLVEEFGRDPAQFARWL